MIPYLFQAPADRQGLAVRTGSGAIGYVCRALGCPGGCSKPGYAKQIQQGVVR